ncbi:MAG: tetratricopeptide repeat protein [Bacteroidia bacterium]
MNTNRFLLYLLLLFSSTMYAQDRTFVDSLEKELKGIDAYRLEMGEAAGHTKDSAEADILKEIGLEYLSINPETAQTYLEKSLKIATAANYRKGMAAAYKNLGVCYTTMGDYPNALKHHFNALKINKEINDQKGIASAFNNLGNIYSYQGDYSTALKYFLDALKIRESIGDKKAIAASYNNIGSIYGQQGNYTEALKYQQLSIQLKAEIGDKAGLASSYNNIGKLYFDQLKNREALRYFNNSLELSTELEDEAGKGKAYNNIGSVYGAMGEYDKALSFYLQSLNIKKQSGNANEIASTFINIGSVYYKKGNLNEAINYEKNGLQIATQIGSLPDMTDACEKLSEIYASQNNYKEAYKFATRFKQLNDSIFNSEENRKITELQMQHEFNLKESENKAEQIKKDALQIAELKKQRIIRNASISGLVVLAILIFILFRRFTEKKKSNLALSEANNNLALTLKNLQDTQFQLVQREKMALLGQLIAGIAHEIRNPLNFVNNFSEISGEMLDEFLLADNDERENIAAQLRYNLNKILEHGKRADHIVETMLEHNNSNSGVKVISNINTLCEEDIALAYYSLRANKNNFNCTIRKDFQENIPAIHIIPQDIHRALINIFNNAFDTLVEKQKSEPTFLPEIIIGTEQKEKTIIVSVKDNGMGIAANQMEKIFQPFYTTKPAGQGTGLGLSLAYELIKAHDGEISIQSEQGKGSTVRITLPIS